MFCQICIFFSIQGITTVIVEFNLLVYLFTVYCLTMYSMLIRLLKIDIVLKEIWNKKTVHE